MSHFSKLNWRLFLSEAFFFSLAQALGLFSAAKMSVLFKTAEVRPVQTSVLDILIMLAVGTAFTLIFLRFSKSALPYKIIFLLVMFFGMQAFFSLFLSELMASGAALLMILARIFTPFILVHNLVLVFGVSAVGAMLGMSLNPWTAVVVLLVLSVYDYIAVYKTKHMVKMAKEMIERGAVFALILPEKPVHYFESAPKIKGPQEGIFFLGAGDLVFPLVMSASVFSGVGLAAAVITAAFSVFGLFLTHFLLSVQEKRAPMPALPPIALLTIIGFFISLL
ncbi:MAG: presenilin family intramembrane aspartyl protease, partial [Patescibacteria group bacterium]